jgi:hypothetical protein
MLKSSGESTCRIACLTCQRNRDEKEDCFLTQEFVQDGSLTIISNYTHCNHCGHSYRQVVVRGADEIIDS